jgi:hypothetical protein
MSRKDKIFDEIDLRKTIDTRRYFIERTKLNEAKQNVSI